MSQLLRTGGDLNGFGISIRDELKTVTKEFCLPNQNKVICLVPDYPNKSLTLGHPEFYLLAP